MLIDGFPEVFVPPSDDFVPEPGSADYNIEDLDLPDCINLENLPDGIVASDLDGIPEDLLRSDFPELFDICEDEESGDNVDKNDNVGGGGGGGGGGGSAPQTDCPGIYTH